MAGEQGVLIDVSHPLDADILRLAKKVRQYDKERSDAQQKADEARGDILALMSKAKPPIERWVKEDFDVTLKIPDASVSVKKRAAKGDDE